MIAVHETYGDEFIEFAANNQSDDLGWVAAEFVIKNRPEGAYSGHWLDRWLKRGDDDDEETKIIRKRISDRRLEIKKARAQNLKLMICLLAMIVVAIVAFTFAFKNILGK